MSGVQSYYITFNSLLYPSCSYPVTLGFNITIGFGAIPLQIEKSRIRETKHLSTDADSRTDTKKILLVGQNSPKNKLVFARCFYTLYKQKFSNMRPVLSIIFPQGFQKYKKFGHWTLGSGGKKTGKQSEKHRYQNILLSRAKFAQNLKSEQTDRHTDRHTYGQIDL